jgi:hypothetical protein
MCKFHWKDLEYMVVKREQGCRDKCGLCNMSAEGVVAIIRCLVAFGSMCAIVASTMESMVLHIPEVFPDAWHCQEVPSPNSIVVHILEKECSCRGLLSWQC